MSDKPQPPSIPTPLTAGMPAGLDPDAAKGAQPYNSLSWLTPQVNAQTPGGGIEVAELVRRSNYFRDNYNPLRGLDIARLMQLFEQAERGAMAEIQLTLRKAEKRFPILKGFIEKLVSSILSLEGKVRVKEQLPTGGTPAMAETQRKFLQDRYDSLKNFDQTIAQLALADIRGYAVLQKHRGDDGKVNELYWIEPWCWTRDGFYGDFYYNQNSQFGIGLGSCGAMLGEGNRVGSLTLPRDNFMVRECGSPLYEIALICFTNWLMARRDYASFVEIFGLPNAVVIMPDNIPPGRQAEYLAQAEATARGGCGAIPHGSDVKFPTQGSRNEQPFVPFCDEVEKDLVKAGTGGALTMLSAPTGIGKGASEEHSDAWTTIAETKAKPINETLQRDFDAPELAAAFPGQPVCVEFGLDIRDTEDVSALVVNVVALEGVGLQCDVDEISARTGLKLTRKELPAPAELPDQNDKPMLNRRVKNANKKPDFAATIADMMAPLKDRLDAIASVDDDDTRQALLAKLLKDAPSIGEAIKTDQSLAKQISPVLAGELLKGLKS